MHLKRLKIWNFRIFGTIDNEATIKTDNPGIEISFDPKLNVLIGENDSGKTAIIDAIRYVLGTRTYDNQWLTPDDLHVNQDEVRAEELKIECLFTGFTHKQAGQFLEWIHTNEKNEYELNVWLSATLKDHKVVQNIRAGIDDEGAFIEGGARDLLRATYLKPLRDADTELSPGYRSRLAQILLNHDVFKKDKNEDGTEKSHPLEDLIEEANKKIKDFFEKEEIEGIKGGLDVTKALQKHSKAFLHTKDSRKPVFNISEPLLPRILRKLGLELEKHKTGLGSMNKLFMATELLQLEIEEGLRLALIEELEAHLHPQAQLRVINALRDIGSETQFILSTHSTTLSSNIPLENLILCYGQSSGAKVFSLKNEETGLEEDDYEFLYRFLDATKSNLFFSRGVIIVEGDAENILLPTIADLLERELYKYGVSIVNVGSTALLRYAKIFKRLDGSSLPVKVSVVSDLDIAQISPGENLVQSKKKTNSRDIPDKKEEINKLKERFSFGNVQVFHSPLWTMEYDLATGSLKKYLNHSTYISQLIKSRSKAKSFRWINETEVDERVSKADKFMKKWVEKGFSEEYQAYLIYKRLNDNMASKSVNAQWLAKMLKENKSDTIELIKSDEKIKYIRDAIYHVTEPPEDADNG